MAVGRRPRGPQPASGLTCVVLAVLVVLGGTAACGAQEGAAGDAGTAIGPGTAPASVIATSVGADRHVCLDRPVPDGDPSGGLPPAGSRSPLGPAAPARLVLCELARAVPEATAGGLTRVEDQAVSGVDALVAALRLPDLPPPHPSGTTQGGCGAIGQFVPELWALDTDGHAVLVRWPVDSCGTIRREASAAFTAVHWQETGRARVPEPTVTAKGTP